MINLTVLDGTWRARRAEISRLCELAGRVGDTEREAIDRAIIRLVEEVGHLHAMLKEARSVGHQ